MTDLKSEIKNAKDKIVGKVKETVGKATDSEELELKGKIQSSKSDLKVKLEETKEKIAGKINDAIDKIKDHKDDK